MRKILLSLFGGFLILSSANAQLNNTPTNGEKGFNYTFDNVGGSNYCNSVTDIFPKNGISISHGGSAGTMIVSFNGNQGATDLLSNRFEGTACGTGFHTLDMSTLTDKKIKIRVRPSANVRIGVLAASNVGGNYTYADGGSNNFQQATGGSYQEIEYTIPVDTWNSLSIDFSQIIGWGIGVRDYSNENVRPTGSITLDVDWIQFGDAVSGGSSNTAPTVEAAIPNYLNLDQGFSPFTIDLKNYFQDAETSDANLSFTYSNNPDINVSISNGVATISASASFTGTNNVWFTATDQGGLSVVQTVNFTVSGVSSSGFNNLATQGEKGFNYAFDNDGGENFCNSLTDVFPKNGISISHGGSAGTMVVNYNGNQGATDVLSSRFEGTLCGTGFHTLDMSTLTDKKIKIRVRPSANVRIGVLAASDVGGNYTYADGGTNNFKQVTGGSYQEIEYTIPVDTWNSLSIDFSQIIGWGIGVRDYSNENVRPTGAISLDIDWIQFGDAVSGGSSNTPPTVEAAIPNYLNLDQGFSPFTIDLKNYFQDAETSDANLSFTYSNNPDINVSISNGVATISASASFTGTNNVWFTATDQGGLDVVQTVNFTVTATSQGFNNLATQGEKGFNYEFDNDGGENFCNSVTDVFPKTGVSVSHGGSNGTMVVDFNGNQGATDLLSNRFEGTQCGTVFHTLDMSTQTDKKIKIRVRSSADVRLGVLAASDIGGNFTYADGGTNNFKQLTGGTYQEIEYIIPIETWNSVSVDFSKIIGWGIGVRDFNNENVRPTGAISLDIDWIQFGDAVGIPVGLNQTDRIEVTAFPNPAKDIINLNGEFNSWDIINSNGELLQSGTENNINIESLTSGIYILRVNNQAIKIVKQ